jgi:hypothetical protein
LVDAPREVVAVRVVLIERVLIDRTGDVRMVPKIVAIDERGSAEVTLRLLARLAIVVPIQSKWILGVNVQGDLGILLVEEALAVESLLGGSIKCWPERADGSQADRDRKSNQPASMEGTGEGHRRALSQSVLPVCSVA